MKALASPFLKQTFRQDTGFGVPAGAVARLFGGELMIDEREQLLGDLGNVTASVTQRGQADRECGQSIEQVFSKRTGGDGSVQVAIRGGDESHIDLDLSLVTQAADRADAGSGSGERLQDSESLGLSL